MIDYESMSLKQLENRLAEMIETQNKAWSDFMYWSCESSIKKINKAIKNKYIMI